MNDGAGCRACYGRLDDGSFPGLRKVVIKLFEGFLGILPGIGNGALDDGVDILTKYVLGCG
ncbi:hypothetical protein [Candidatus Brocadia sinica]|uniref:hypothetical protein n=1 Tax=Candidatus Brocadia sinica TaxID=795830 RepID=UPI000697A400|nr:hypothetical protein [Candidatus Brocadia sinica]